MKRPEMKLPGMMKPYPPSIFLCPHHQSLTDDGWCWECAQETYGYEEAKRVYERLRQEEVQMCQHYTVSAWPEMRPLCRLGRRATITCHVSNFCPSYKPEDRERKGEK